MVDYVCIHGAIWGESFVTGGVWDGCKIDVRWDEMGAG